jgi:hypothetical protein
MTVSSLIEKDENKAFFCLLHVQCWQKQKRVIIGRLRVIDDSVSEGLSLWLLMITPTRQGLVRNSGQTKASHWLRDRELANIVNC